MLYEVITCISQWGYDFRPSYLKVAEVRELIPHVPVLALTATATPQVVDDIQERLLFKTKNVFQKSFGRSNRITSYNVCYTKLLRLRLHRVSCRCIIPLFMVKRFYGKKNIFSCLSMILSIISKKTSFLDG